MKFEGKQFLTKSFVASSYLSDLNGRLSIPSMLSIFQEMAWEHATINSFGFDYLREQGLFWVISRISIDISRLPKWREEFSVTTWPSGVDGLLALRDFQISDCDGSILVGATTSWLIVDMKTRRPQRIDTFREKMPICDSYRAAKANAERININLHSPKIMYETSAKISDIDVNGHINNTKYVEWEINSVSEKIYRETEIQRIVVNYLAEGFSGDILLVKSSELDEKIIVSSITRKIDSKNLALVQIIKAL